MADINIERKRRSPWGLLLLLLLLILIAAGVWWYFQNQQATDGGMNADSAAVDTTAFGPTQPAGAPPAAPAPSPTPQSMDTSQVQPPTTTRQ